jgi:hypothetical protein
MGWVDKQVEDAVDFVTQDIPSKVENEIIEPTKEFGKSVDDFVNEEIPGGWYTVAAATGAYFAPEIMAIGNSAEAAALAEGATVAEAAAAGASAAEAAAGTNYLGSQALGSASTGAVGSGTTGFGLSAGTATGGAAAGTGINAGALGGMGYLGGAGNLAVGTAGLTAEQIAQAELAGQIGSNASSGMGYLGGAESLPSGTAGITGVTAPTSLSLSDAQRALRLGQSLLGGQQQPVGQPQQQQQIKPRGMVDYSPTLSLLELQRVKTPNIYSLLG